MLKELWVDRTDVNNTNNSSEHSIANCQSINIHWDKHKIRLVRHGTPSTLLDPNYFAIYVHVLPVSCSQDVRFRRYSQHSVYCAFDHRSIAMSTVQPIQVLCLREFHQNIRLKLCENFECVLCSLTLHSVQECDLRYTDYSIPSKPLFI